MFKTFFIIFLLLYFAIFRLLLERGPLFVSLVNSAFR